MKAPLRLFLLGAALALVAVAAGSTISYTYDPAGRLTSADHGAGKSISYAYNNAGNLIQLSQPAPGIVAGPLVGNQFTLSWPAAPAGFILQSSATIGPGATWTNANLTVIPNGDLQTVTISINARTTFYRLQK